MKRLKSMLSRERLELLLSHSALALIPLIQKIPDRWVAPIGHFLGMLAFRLWGRVRKIAIENLTHAFPEHDPKKIREFAYSTFCNWGLFVLETIRLPGYTERDWQQKVVMHGMEHYDQAAARGNGVIIVTGHLGCFEIGAAWGAHLKLVPISVVVRYAKTRKITEEITRVREAAGYKVLAYDARGFRAMRSLRNKEVVFMLIDQDAGGHGVFVEFFGRPVSAPPGPAVLAGRSGAALLCGWVVLEEDGKHHLYLEPEVPNPGPRPSPEAVQAAMQDITSRLEAIVRRHPDQWLWMHRRWKTQPGSSTPGQAPVEEDQVPEA